MTLSTKQKQALTDVLDGLMKRYKKRVSDVDIIISSMLKKGLVKTSGDIINDHIAFRTMGVPLLGIQSLEKIFLTYGYQKRDFYQFETKKLNAYWFSPPSDIPNLPRIFISECRVSELSKPVQDIIYHHTKEVTTDPVNKLNLLDGNAVDNFLHTPLWSTPTWEDYETVLAESEYAAWVLYNRYYLNHFTITIQALNKGYNTIESFNTFLTSIGISLNTSGGVIKRSKDGKLLQSASVAKEITALFPHRSGGEHAHQIAGSYVEFAQRIDGRDGFEVGNADKIFESTFSDQINQSK